MIRVLIADDELLVRIGLKAAIDWEKHGFAIVGEVGNGWDALMRVKDGGVDVLLLDIRMPLMNGIEVMNAIRQENLSVHVIILSAHEEGEYVQEALRLGASDYMLKLSLQPEKLLRALHKVRDEMALPTGGTPTDGERHPRARWLHALQAGGAQGLPMQTPLQSSGNLREERICVLCILCDADQHAGPAGAGRAAPDPGGPGEARATAPKYIEGIITDVINNYARGECFQTEPDLFVAVINPRSDDKSQLQAIAQTVGQSIRKYTNSCVSIGVSGVYPALSSVAQALAEARRALGARYAQGRGSVLCAQDMPPDTPDSPPILPGEDQAFLQAVQQGDAAAANAILDRFARAVETHWYLDKRVITGRAYDFMFILLRVMRDAGVRLEGHALFMGSSPIQRIEAFAFFSDLAAFLQRVTASCIDQLRQLRKQDSRHQAILRARAYIDANLGADLSLSKLAALVGLSKSHFSHLFKKEMGEGVVNYIHRARIEHSKRLLATTSKTISSVAEETGFHDIYYFSNAFKKSCGMSPSEYKRSLPK